MRKISSAEFRLLMISGTALGLSLTTTSAMAQSVAPDSAQDVTTAEDGQAADIVVTGSRIGRSAAEIALPVAIVEAQSVTDRGYVSLGQALNTEPSINRQLAQAPGNGMISGPGVQSPSLFGLGVGRTLTLVNGRRTATTASGLGDSQVDSNIIPLGLLDRVEIVQAGAAAVYGSDAIAGVVNYVLKRDFEGIEADVQGSITSRGDYPIYSARLTAGTNFGGGRGNIAANVEWSKIAPLGYDTRPRTLLNRVTVTNPADTGPNDGVPSVRELLDARFWEYNANGVVLTTPAPVPMFLTGRQFAPDGSVVPYNAGAIAGVPFAAGGEGLPYSALVGTLRTGIERGTFNAIGHYDVTNDVTISAELLYAHTKSEARDQVLQSSVLGSAALGSGAIAFTNANPYLSPDAIDALIAISPSFASGAPLFLSKAFFDLLPDARTFYTADAYRGLLGVSGHFDIGARAFSWNVSGSYARVDGSTSGWDRNIVRFNNAINAVVGNSGQIICAINADAVTTNDDPDCAPINPFGAGNVSDAAKNYVSQRSGSTYRNEQINLIASINGEIARLPGGKVRTALTYEHRDERVSFTPFAANAKGVFAGSPVVAQSGRYHTHEFSGELIVPLVGGDFSMPLVKSLEFQGAYRYIDNSIAGRENVWNIGATWDTGFGLTFRGSRSRNFRAPTLTQLFAPSSSAMEAGNLDPCDADRISGGPNPAQRSAACLALFEANPTYGTGGPGGAAAGSSAAVRLATFQNSGENFNTTLVSTGGNAALRNEISKTWTYGLLFQPRFIRGLTLSADRIEIDLTDGLSAFTTADFAASCYDDPNPAAGTCGAFTRMSAATPSSQAGSFATGRTTTFNAGIIRYRGEIYKLNYVLPVGEDSKLGIGLAATHTSKLESSVTGTVFVRSDHTANNSITGTPQPSWVGRLNLNYDMGPFRASYEAYYMGPAKAAPNATIENNPHWHISSNLTHSVSFAYDLGSYGFRFGVNNLTDKQPSYPRIDYGDIIGRQFFAGARVRF